MPSRFIPMRTLKFRPGHRINRSLHALLAAFSVFDWQRNKRDEFELPFRQFTSNFHVQERLSSFSVERIGDDGAVGQRETLD